MEENDSKANKATWTAGMSDVVLSCVIPYIEDPKDRDAVSLVCRRWYELDALTRKHITITASCTTTLNPLRRRFGHLESLKFKGKPRTSMFRLISEDYMPPWAREIAENFNYLKSLHFVRMTVRDPALELLARSRGSVLQVLKIDKCRGLSTDGLLHVGRFCRQLRTLLLEDSTIVEKDGQWLHELAMNNTVLESLNFYMTDLGKVSVKDLELIAKNCSSLVSVKVSDFEVSDLVDFFGAATALKEFSGASFKAERENYSDIQLPPRLCSLGLLYMEKNEMPMLFPFATSLRKLDLLYTFLDTEDLCLLIQRCPNLEILEARNVIGDRGLEVLAQSCKRLKRLRIERGADEQGLEDEEVVSEEGLITLAQGCLELEYLSIYISDITNAALECIGTYLNNLSDFRLVLLDREERITDLSLDNGVRALLMGCKKLRRIALYLRPGCLTDLGLCFIDHYRPNVRWKHLNIQDQSCS